ncbi:GAF domain-containing protein [Bradyrhizobium barranii subsp. apii]|uniref:helix-turn-helix domain-containing protein n=1 Tax=Bradyrhizobium barranii TaxID=2992140 RepID=UPI001AA0D21A|nr:helix-turn-helix domain-containing protein [Bradyrhizobium barranii]UPT92875.1 GAF domain-containing protein [Bradyrhizobium barranii subsp. apii]
MNGPMSRHHAARVEAAIASGQAARSALVASWRRSSRLHHLDPAGRSAPMRLSDVELRQARERVAPLLAAAQGAMDRLYQAVDRRGTAVDDATFQSWGLWTGALWSEDHEGTNGIGTCVVEQRPLTIDRDQHFFTRNTLLSCTAVPIYDHEAEFAGVLDVSSCRADRTDTFSNLIALAAGEAARRIEADLFRRAFAHARIVLTQGADGQAGGLVAVDADDLVIGATRSARVGLGIAPGRPLQPVPAADLLGGEPAHDHLAGGQRAVLQRALLRADGNVSAAAKALGISRATLHRKLKRFELKH